MQIKPVSNDNFPYMITTIVIIMCYKGGSVGI